MPEMVYHRVKMDYTQVYHTALPSEETIRKITKMPKVEIHVFNRPEQ